jgi:hypothetical protein
MYGNNIAIDLAAVQLCIIRVVDFALSKIARCRKELML